MLNLGQLLVVMSLVAEKWIRPKPRNLLELEELLLKALIIVFVNSFVHLIEVRPFQDRSRAFSTST